MVVAVIVKNGLEIEQLQLDQLKVDASSCSIAINLKEGGGRILRF